MSDINNTSFDVIITTYCRAENVVVLANKILSITPLPNQLIIVDTSPQINENLKGNPSIRYIRSNLNHQNQPYKRLVGALAATCDKIIFFDDDIEIIDDGVFRKMLPLLNQENVVGITSDIDYQDVHDEPSKIKKRIIDTLLWFTGKPMMKSGKMGLAGYHGAPPKDKVTEVGSLSGPIMGFNRELFLKLPDLVMLTLFDKQLIIPEDKLLSIRASKLGRLLYYPEQLVKHPKIQSTYFLNIRDYTKRVHFSRFILNRELGKNKNTMYKIVFDLHFLYYSFWRILIAGIQTLTFSKIHRGKIAGFFDAIKLYYNYSFGNFELISTLLTDAELDAADTPTNR